MHIIRLNSGRGLSEMMCYIWHFNISIFFISCVIGENVREKRKFRFMRQTIYLVDHGILNIKMYFYLNVYFSRKRSQNGEKWKFKN